MPGDQARRLSAGARGIGHLRLGGALAERLLLTGAELDARAARARRASSTALVPADGDPERLVLDWYRADLAPLSAFALREATLRRAARHRACSPRLGAPLDRRRARATSQRLLPSHDGNEGIEAFLAQARAALGGRMSRRARRAHEAAHRVLDAAPRARSREHGYHGMSMRDLARATGRALASFYTYFGSKEDILFELQQRAFQHAHRERRGGRSARPASPSARLHALHPATTCATSSSTPT